MQRNTGMVKPEIEQWTQHTTLWNSSIQNEHRRHVIAQSNRLRSVSEKVQNPTANVRADTQALELMISIVGITVLKAELKLINMIPTNLLLSGWERAE